MKLSTMFTKADRELRQVRGIFGNAGTKQACAMGAVCYYLSKGDTVTPYLLHAKEGRWYESVLKKFAKKTGKNLATWNDSECKSFRELAVMAREAQL